MTPIVKKCRKNSLWKRDLLTRASCVVFFLCAFVVMQILSACSGTDIPNGASNQDETQTADIPSNNVPNPTTVGNLEVKNFTSLQGRVSREAVQKDQTLFVFSNAGQVLGKIITDAEGRFVLNFIAEASNAAITLPLLIISTGQQNSISENNNTPPMYGVVAKNPSATSNNPEVASAYLNPITSEVLRAFFASSLNLDTFAQQLYGAEVLALNGINVVKNAKGEILPSLFQFATDTKAFQTQLFTLGDTLVNQVFGAGNFSTSENHPFQLFLGADQQIYTSLKKRQSQSALGALTNSAELPNAQLVDLLLLALHQRGALEKVIQKAVAAPLSDGNYLNQLNYVYDLAALALTANYTLDIYQNLSNTSLKTTLAVTQQALQNSTQTAVNGLLQQSTNSSNLNTNTFQVEAACSASMSYRPPALNTLSNNPVHYPLETLDTTSKQRLLAQALGQVLSILQTKNPTWFNARNQQMTITNTTNLAVTILSNEVNRAFPLNTVDTHIYLESYLNALTKPLAIVMATQTELSVTVPYVPAKSIQENWQSAVHNIALNLDLGLNLIRKDTRYNDHARANLFDLLTQEMAKIILDKDISANNGAISSLNQSSLSCLLESIRY